MTVGISKLDIARAIHRCLNTQEVYFLKHYKKYI